MESRSEKFERWAKQWEDKVPNLAKALRSKDLQDEVERITNSVPQKCDSCVFQKYDTTGIDEYPARTVFMYCSKGHWQQFEPEGTYDKDYWADCKDYHPIINEP